MFLNITYLEYSHLSFWMKKTNHEYLLIVLLQIMGEGGMDRPAGDIILEDSISVRLNTLASFLLRCNRMKKKVVISK